MNWSTWKKRLGFERRIHAGQFVAPTFALDLQPGFVAAARLRPSKRMVQGVDVQELAAGVLVPSANKSNVTVGAALRRTIAGAAVRVGTAGGKLGLLIPDLAARVALLPFETLPEGHREAETLVLWRMREHLPYAPEEARLSYQILAKQPGLVEVLCVAMRNSVLAEYEAATAAINGGPALVLPATVALLPLLPEDGSGQLLLHLCPGALTAVVVASNRVRYWRTRSLEDADERHLEEVVREATRVLAACQDSLGVQVQNVWFCARPLPAPEVEAALAAAMGRQPKTLPADCFPAGGLPPGDRAAFAHFGLPFAGLVANVKN